MIANHVTRVPVDYVACPKCMVRVKKDDPQASYGILFRVDLSRLEEALGHEGFKCNQCGRTIKYVPPAAATK